MVPVELFCGPVWQQLAWTLLHFVWQGFLVMAAVAALGWLCPLARAESRHALALLGLVVMAICPVVTFALLLLPTPAFWSLSGVSGLACPLRSLAQPWEERRWHC